MNEIQDILKIPVYLREAMKAFKARLLPLGLFSTSFNVTPITGKREVVVPYYPLSASESKIFDGTYKFDKGQALGKTIAIDKRKYQSLTKSSEEAQTLSGVVDYSAIFAQKANKLADDILKDILSVFTVANFSPVVLDTTAANFDADDVVDIETACDEANWPDQSRGLILKGAWFGAVKKSLIDKGGNSTFGGNVLAAGLPDLFSFKAAKSQNLASKVAGVAVHPSAVLVGMSPIQPAGAIDYQTYTDPETGLTLEYRRWFEPGNDRLNEVIECNYGFVKGEAAAAKIITDGTN